MKSPGKMVAIICTNPVLYSTGPEVFLDCDHLDMGVVESGKFAAKSFKIINNADVPAAFQVKKQL